MKVTEETCKDSKKTCQNSQEVTVQTSQSIKKIQNIDGKFQEIMHMPCNLTFKMQIINGKMLLIWKLNRSKNTKYSKNMGKLFMTRIKLEILPRVRFVFDVKHCGKFKARIVAVGHLTKEPKKPMETVYSGAVSLRNL